tara:strand:- start:149 stop:652 length:504 start_codon:yes stop_codon:yes gene_type:complete
MAEDTIFEEEIEENLEEEDENILLWATLGVSFGIDVFITRIERELAVLRNAGISEPAIISILGNDLANNGRIFGEFRNTIKRGIVSAVMQASRIGQDRVYGDSMMFQWVSVGTPKICVDCQSRIGQIKSWEEWEAIGLPASGFSVCKEYCYCQLVPVEVPMPSSLSL